MAALLLSATAVALAACSDGPPATQGLTGTVRVAGSSSLAPLVRAGAADLVGDVEPGVQVDVAVTGTADGLRRLCAPATPDAVEVAMASREPTAEELAACEAAGVEPVEVVLARDGVAVVVPARNDWVRCLTGTELARLWSSDDPPATWAEVRDGLPEVALAPYAPGPASGTAEVFAAEVLDGGPLRPDAARSEDDAVVVEGVAASPGGVGVVPSSYAGRAAGVRAVAVDLGDGCVASDARSVDDGSYGPLARELRVLVDRAAYDDDRSVRALVDLLHARADALAESTGAVPRSAAQRTAAARALGGAGA